MSKLFVHGRNRALEMIEAGKLHQLVAQSLVAT